MDPRTERVRAALAGRFDATAMSDKEAARFDGLVGEAMGGWHTAEARSFWASFASKASSHCYHQDSTGRWHSLQTHEWLVRSASSR